MKKYTEIKAKELKIGMCFSAPVFFDDGVNMFLAEKKPVRQFHLDVIRQWKISKLMSYGHIIDANNKGELTEDDEIPELEELDEVEELEEIEEVEEALSPDEGFLRTLYDTSVSSQTSVYEKAVKNMAVVFASVKEGGGSSRSLVDETADSLFHMVKKDGVGFVNLILNKGTNRDYSSAAVNIAVMAGATAFAMDLPDRQILHVMMAALLHDIFMPFVSHEIINKKGKLTSSEFELLKLHTVRGADYLSENLLIPRTVVEAVLQHHEYYDGKGYPEGRQGKNIGVAGRIISVCDAFDAMVSEKPYRDALIGYEAVKSILRMSGSQFDPAVVGCFVKSIGVYPAGTVVLMSNVSVAKVVEGSEDALFLPVVRIIAKGYGDIPTGTVIKLKEQRSVFIIRPLNREEAMKFA